MDQVKNYIKNVTSLELKLYIPDYENEIFSKEEAYELKKILNEVEEELNKESKQ